MKFDNTLTTLVRQSLESGSTPALMGEPGIGKSSFVEGLAHEMDTKAFVLPMNQLADKADLTGARLVPTPDGKSFSQVFYPHHVIQEAIEYALENPREHPILFLDEINRTTSDVTSGALTLVTLRKMGHITLPSNLRLMVAGNDRGNVVSLDEASLSRFTIFRVEPDAHTLISVLGAGLNRWIKEVLTQFPTLVFEKSTPAAIAADGDDDDDDTNGNVTVADIFEAGEEMNQLTTPRTIDNLSRWLNVADLADLAVYLQTPAIVEGREATVLNEAIEAYVGNTKFATQVSAAISREISSGLGGPTTNQLTVPRPNCYAGLKAATSITDLSDQLSQLTEKEKASSLLYALKESADNSRLIEQLALVTTSFEREHKQLLVEMLTSQQFDRGNLDAFLEVSAPVVDNLSPIISTFL